MTLPIGSGLCLDCQGSQPLTVHGFCGTCGSDAILPRRLVEVAPYSPDELTRLAGNVETTPDELVMP